MTITSIDWAALISGILSALILICIISFVFVKLIKYKDEKKPLITKDVKVLEKKISQGNIEWYNIEASDGERLLLRNFHANKMIISTGDSGKLSYKGKTIISFERSAE